MPSVTVYVHQPPFEMKSVTKNQATTTVIAAMNGNSQRAWAMPAAMRIRNSSERCASDHTPKGEFQLFSQPNQCHSEPIKKAQAITVAKPKIPAATHVPARRHESASNNSATKMRSAQAARAP